MSMGPNSFFVSAKARSTAAASTMSALKVRTWTPGCWASTSFLVEVREDSVRPMMVIFIDPAVAKAWVMRGPIPEPPPVMKTTLPFMESSGRVGLMAG